MRVITRALAAVLFTIGLANGTLSPTPEDAVIRLENRIGRGEAALDFDGRFGYLPSLLKELSINVDSQVLVFSKTSLQRDHISAESPRAVYFNDEVAVGSVHDGEIIEILAVQPQGRLNFYSLDIHRSDSPEFQREPKRCGVCHGPAGGMTVSSVFTNDDGTPFYSGLFDYVDHRTPFENRWGGWYVSGNLGGQSHMGTALNGRIEAPKYLAPTSDVVALMTLEHQAHMTNLIADVTEGSIGEIVDYMLFVDEAPLTRPVQGVSTFTQTFPQHGPRDKRGRSLRDFDLRKRLFRYPLSYMVYSDAFANIKPALRTNILQHISQVLIGADHRPKFDRLSADDRIAILEIARDTIPGFPQ